MDDDFEHVGRSWNEKENTPVSRNSWLPPLHNDDDGGGSPRRPDETCGVDRNSVSDAKLPASLASDPAAETPGKARHSEREGAKTNTCDSIRDATGGSSGSSVDSSTAAAAAAGLQRKVVENESGRSTPSATAASSPAGDGDSVPRTERGKGEGESGFHYVSSSISDGAKVLRRRDSLRARAGIVGNSTTAATSGGRGLDALTMSGECSVSSAADQREDEAAERGRRISRTEGAVETMRKKLSAMGFLEPGSGSPSCGVNETVATATKVSDKEAKQSVDTLSETPVEAARDRGLGAGSAGSAAAAAVIATVAAAEQENEWEHTRAVGATDEDKDGGRTDSTPTPSSPPVVREDKHASPPPSQRQGSPSSSGPDGEGVRTVATADELSDCLSVDIRGSSVDISEPRYPPSLQTPDPRPRESGSSTLSSGSRRRRRRRNNPPSSKQKRSCSKEKISSSPLSNRVIVLPRPDTEYEAALVRLTEAASHAAQLYHELTEATSGSLESRRTGTGTGRGEGSVAGMQSFPSTSSAELGRRSLGLDEASAGEMSFFIYAQTGWSRFSRN